MISPAIKAQINRIIAQLDRLEEEQARIRESYASYLAQMAHWHYSQASSTERGDSRVSEALASIDEQLRSIQARDVTPRKRTTRRKSAPTEETTSEQGTRTEDTGVDGTHAADSTAESSDTSPAGRLGGDPPAHFEESIREVEENTHDTEETEPPTPAPGAESHGQPAGTDTQESDGTPEPVSEPAEGAVSEELRNELARWRERAIDDVAAWRERRMEDVSVGSALRGFTTTIIPERTHQWISKYLAGCENADDVRWVFSQVGEPSPGEQPVSEASTMSKDTLKQHIHELFSNVAERGHKALGEESAE